ncbi:hypothetical protein [Cryptosporangium phraense]|uniref:Uncharacterized protein n=1 Tax=Cryptosporangium phraense TaxID=2593070 RepID=A0A545AZE6_9ACTN|nr:hypothetical protein [Cryptosporangium phraense]TQS45975.1 hypothetical protein FL583_05640 [Cryptosporangium phraense]
MIIGIGPPSNVETTSIDDAVVVGRPRRDTLVMQHYTARLDVMVADVRRDAPEGDDRFHLVHEPEEVAAAPDVARWLSTRYPSG